MLKIDSVLLKQVFNYLSPSLSMKSKNPYSKAILIEGKDGKVQFRANNSLVESTVNLVIGDYEIEEDFIVCVDQFIQDIITRLSGEVHFLIDKDELLIKVDNNEFRFGTLDTQKFSKKIPNENKLYIVEDKKEFFEAFDITKFCTSDNPTVQIYKSFNLSDDTIATTNEVMGVILLKPLGNSNPPVKELNSILSAIKTVEDEDEIFYRFDEKICIIKVATKNIDIEYLFSPIDGKFPDAFFDMIRKYTTELTPDLMFTIEEENISTIIDTANIFAAKAKQEGHLTSLTMLYDKNEVNFLMEIPTVSEFNIITPTENLETQVKKLKVYLDPIDFKKFLELGGDPTIKFFKNETGFICTTSKYDDLIYFQSTVRKRK